MKQLLILSNVVIYVKYNKHKNVQTLNVSTVNKGIYKRNSSKEEKEKHVLDLDF